MANEHESTMKWKVDITQLKKSMQDAKRSITQANAEFKTATASMDRWSKSTDGLEAKITQLNKTLPAQKQILADLEKQYEVTAKNMGENSKEAVDLKVKIEEQRATIVKTETSINKYNDQLNELQQQQAKADTATGKLNKTISDQEDKLDSLKDEYVEAVLQYGKTSKEAQDLAKQIIDLSGELAQNKDVLKDATDAADEFDKTMKDAAEETEDAAEEADKAEGKFSGLGSALVNVAKVGIAAFATAVAATVTGLAKATVEAAAYADEMITMATVTGVSTEALQAYNYAADLVDVSMETLTGSMAKNVKSMANAAKGSKEYAAAYDKLGISVTDSNGKLRDSEEVYWEAIDALGEMEEGAERDALAMQIFGKSAQDLNPLIAQGSDGIAELTKEAKEMGAVLSDEQLADLGAFDDAVQRLKQGSEAAKRALGLVLLPQLQELADSGKKLLGEFTNGMIEANGDWSKISDVMGKTIGSVVDLILQKMPAFMQVGTAMVSAIVGSIVQNLPQLTTAAINVLTTLTQGFLNALPQVVTIGTQIILAILTGLSQALPEIAVQIVQIVPVIVQALAESIPLLIDGALQFLLAIVQAIPQLVTELQAALPQIIETILAVIVNSVPQLLEAALTLFNALIEAIPVFIPIFTEMLPQIIETIITVLTQNLPLILQMGVKTLVELIKGLTKAIPQLIRMVPQIIKSIVNTLYQNLPQIMKSGVQILTELVSGIRSVIGKLREMALKIVTTILEVVAKLPKDMLETGTNLVKGIWQGISSSLEWIKGKIKGWVGNVTKFIKKLFGINSPSKVMADEIGKFLPSGIALGFEDDMPEALASMKKSLSGALGDLKENVALTADGMFDGLAVNGASSAAKATQQIVNFNQYNNSPKALNRLDIYRDTNSLLFSAKVRLANV